MDDVKSVPMTDAELTAANLEGINVYGLDDTKLGRISHLHGVPPHAKAVIEVGGILGLGAKPVALPISSLSFMRDETGEAHATTILTKDQLKAMPDHTH